MSTRRSIRNLLGSSGASRGDKSSAASRRMRQLTEAIRRATTTLKRRLPKHIVTHWERVAPYFLALGHSSEGNRVTLYEDGDDALEAMWNAVTRARRSVWLEMYTLEPDKVGTRTLQALEKAAKRGCDVLVSLDAVGSSGLTQTHVQPLRSAGADVRWYNPLLTWARRGPFLCRDHRKLLVVDGHVAFCGGMNLSELYAGKKYGQCCFADCHAKVEGPAVSHLAAMFQRTWKHLGGKRSRVRRRLRRRGDSFVQVLASAGLMGRRPIQRALLYAIRHSRMHCLITNPYVVPSASMTRALTGAADRGVDVRLLTAGTSDVPVVRYAMLHLSERFLRHGIRIYEMFDRTLHAKTVEIDGVFASVGSFNLDQWSDRRNLEINLAIFDPGIADQLSDRFHRDLAGSRELTLDSLRKRRWYERLLHWLAYQLMRI